MKFLIDSCKLVLPSTKPHSTGTKKTIEALSKIKWGQTETHLLDALVAVCLTPEESHKTLKEPLNGSSGQKCLCIQSVSSSICCLGSTKRRRKKRFYSVLTAAVQRSGEQKQRQDCFGHSYELHKGAKLVSSVGFNLRLRAAHIRAPHPTQLPPHYVLTCS